MEGQTGVIVDVEKCLILDVFLKGERPAFAG